METLVTLAAHLISWAVISTSGILFRPRFALPKYATASATFVLAAIAAISISLATGLLMRLI